jgi:hypothetical protein
MARSHRAHLRGSIYFGVAMFGKEPSGEAAGGASGGRVGRVAMSRAGPGGRRPRSNVWQGAERRGREGCFWWQSWQSGYEPGRAGRSWTAKQCFGREPSGEAAGGVLIAE